MSESIVSAAVAAPTETVTSLSSSPAGAGPTKLAEPVAGPPTVAVTAPTAVAGPTESASFSWAGADGRLSDGWADHLPDDLKPQASALAGLAGKYHGSIPELLKGALHLQGIAGRKIGAPTAEWTPEQVAEYRAAHGVPEAPDKYDFTPPEGALPEGITWNAEVFQGVKEWAHRSHVPAAAVKELPAVLASVDRARQQAAMQMVLDRDAATEQALRTELGADYDRKMTDAARAANFLGVDVNPETNPVANHPEFIKMMVRVAGVMGESKLVQGGPGFASQQPGRLRAQEIMNPNGADPLTRDYQGENGYDRQRAAQAVVNELLAG